MVTILLVALLLLLLGDFFATFAYHVPEHVFGKFHGIVHHSPNRSFIRYAYLNRRPIALIDGFLSAFPYLAFIPWLWPLSPAGVVLGLALAELHVIWRHRFPPKHHTPEVIQTCCRYLGITTPERHWKHHCNGHLAFGDIFAFYGPPGRFWLETLLSLRRYIKRSW